jgi:hypothetical protein
MDTRVEEAQSGMREGRKDGGFALILALMALMLLTFLGLTLAVSTSTELRISNNYRWSQQAQYNAEAGIEVARNLLRTMDWGTILPTARAATWEPDTFTSPGLVPTAKYARADAIGLATRNFENGPCDTWGNGAGYGVVLDDGGADAPYQNKTTILGQSLNGAITLWIRRPLVTSPDGIFTDNTSSDALVITSEGSAPFVGAAMGSVTAQTGRAVHVMEATLARTVDKVCGSRGGQTGGGPEGAGFSPCDPIDGSGLKTVVGGAPTDTGVK